MSEVHTPRPPAPPALVLPAGAPGAKIRLPRPGLKEANKGDPA